MLSVTGIQVESGAREETGRFKDVKTCVATGDRTGSQELASCSITTTQPQHDTTGQRHRAFDVFIVPVTLSSSPSRSSPQTILCYECHGNLCGVRKLREETGRFRDVKRWVSTGDRTRVSGIGILHHNCGPPQHDITGPCHRAFDVFQGSCYTFTRQRL